VQLNFVLDDNGNTGSGGPQLSPSESATIDVTPCYCPGTLIKTAGGEKRVEELKIGDKVLTASGAARPIKWIGRRSYGGRFVMGRKDILPVCIKACALDDNVPKRDLWISPHHAMYFDGVLIEAKDLVNGVSIVQAERVDKLEYFHVELDTHDVIIAEGALAESYLDDDNRMMFHNAPDYYALDQEAASAPAHYCAPRLQEGYEVEHARQRIAARAGLLRAAVGGHIGTLRGYVDEAGAHRVAGWAQSIDHPEAPVCLDIYANNKLIGQVLANRYREDLKQAGIGTGRHGFEFTPPAELSPGSVEVRRSLDGAVVARASGTVGVYVKIHRRAAL
jgi:Hint domain